MTGLSCICCCSCCWQWYQRQQHARATTAMTTSSSTRNSALTAATAAHCRSSLLQASAHAAGMPEACCSSSGCQATPVTVAAAPAARYAPTVSAAVKLQAMAVCAALRPLWASHTAPALSAGLTQPHATTAAAAASGAAVTTKRLASYTQGATADAFTQPLTEPGLRLTGCQTAPRHAGKPFTAQCCCRRCCRCCCWGLPVRQQRLQQVPVFGPQPCMGMTAASELFQVR